MMKKPDIQNGFTLIEVMVTMVVGLVILAGVASLFVSQTRVAQTLNQKSEVMNDLFLASQIMQSELRNAKRICWNSTYHILVYEPVTSATVVTSTAGSGDCNVNAGTGKVDSNTGGFKFTSDAICWNRPNSTRCEQLIRNMQLVAGLSVSPSVNSDLYTVRTVTLTSEYQGMDLNTQNLKLPFKVWPRNQ